MKYIFNKWLATKINVKMNNINDYQKKNFIESLNCYLKLNNYAIKCHWKES